MNSERRATGMKDIRTHVSHRVRLTASPLRGLSHPSVATVGSALSPRVALFIVCTNHVVTIAARHEREVRADDVSGASGDKSISGGLCEAIACGCIAMPSHTVVERRADKPAFPKTSTAAPSRHSSVAARASFESSR